MRIIKTIYQNLTGILCNHIGNNSTNDFNFISSTDWVRIGFQSNDFKTDLRSTGMFSLLQTLAFLDRLNPFVREIFEYSLDSTFHFPFMCTLINISQFSLEALREGYLIPYCNKRMSVIENLNEYFFGLVDHFYTIYKNSNQTLEFVNSILQRVNSYAKGNVDHIFRLSKSLMGKYPKVKDSMSLEDVDESK
jgi:hypothetical protein